MVFIWLVIMAVPLFAMQKAIATVSLFLLSSITALGPFMVFGFQLLEGRVAYSRYTLIVSTDLQPWSNDNCFVFDMASARKLILGTFGRPHQNNATPYGTCPEVLPNKLQARSRAVSTFCRFV